MCNYKDIQDKFNEVLEKSQYMENINSDQIFSQWEVNKKRFIDKWGGLTYELPHEVQLDLPEDIKEVMMKDFAADCSVYSFEDDISILFRSGIVKDFILSQGVEGFYSNRVLTKWVSQDKKIVINKGAKLSKSLKFFGFRELILGKFQERLSRLIQDCKIKGRLVMSVHPLDFLSSSETAHNWHSCHALDGEFRAGNLSYMMDKHTFMVYLKSEKDYKLPNFPFEWNSKKWRTLMYMTEDEDMIVSGRQYPMTNGAMDIVVSEMIGKFYNLSDFTKEWQPVGDYISRIMKDEIGSLHYNDCLNSPSYSPVAIYNEKTVNVNEIEKEKKMVIGDAVPCLSCGGMMISLSSEFVCDECGDFTCCECCGDTLTPGNEYCLEGIWTCESCYDEYVAYCGCCDEPFDSESGNIDYYEEYGEYFCSYCYHQMKKREKEESGK